MDHNNDSKRYGGDYFRFKIYSSKLKAGAFGSVRDLENGQYAGNVTLFWAGDVQIDVKLIHSSETVELLRRLRDSAPDKVYFYGYFEQSGAASERTVCNMFKPADGNMETCEYPDRATGEVWFCVKPKILSCESLRYHSMGSIKTVTTNKDSPFLSAQPCESECIATLPFFSELSCHFFSSPCLCEGMQIIDVHSPKQMGPLLATGMGGKTFLSYRCHGFPLRSQKGSFAAMHYIANELDGIPGGKDTVVAFTLWAHFTSYPVIFYVKRIRNIRASIVRLLARSPETLVIIKTANTSYKSIIGSDWLAKQLDQVMRQMMAGLQVVIVDVWDMTAAHRFPDQIHPPALIIMNEISLVLSYLCPK
ncbi:NXPE family member 3-like [Petromyzon marinus]|uniref:NXPE family member 3-like n=1 Tax=Petromyzon marinus TaxID=7757 RepID=UPI003F6FF5F9